MRAIALPDDDLDIVQGQGNLSGLSVVLYDGAFGADVGAEAFSVLVINDHVVETIALLSSQVDAVSRKNVNGLSRLEKENGIDASQRVSELANGVLSLRGDDSEHEDREQKGANAQHGHGGGDAVKTDAVDSQGQNLVLKGIE
jgi:hypothetical protein